MLHFPKMKAGFAFQNSPENFALLRRLAIKLLKVDLPCSWGRVYEIGIIDDDCW